MIPPAPPGAKPSADGLDPSSRAGVARTLDGLAKSADISPATRTMLTELSSVLRTSEDFPQAADGWVDFDLVGTFARAETFIDILDHTADGGEFRHRRLLTLLEVLQGVFIFVPLLITWFGLQQAASAYHRMLADPVTSAAARSGNFLELWQTGFGGKLIGLLKFEWAALYTLCAILVLIGVTIVTAELRRRDDEWREKQDLERETAEHQRDRDRQSMSSELLVTLARAQLIFNRDRLATPARFAAELSHAAAGLGVLLAQAEATQRSTLEVAGRYDQTARELTAAVTGLTKATSVMNAAAADVRRAADVLDSSGRELRTDVTAQVTGAAGRLEAATAAAESELLRQRELGRSTLEQLTERSAATLSDVAGRVRAATDELVAAGDAYANAIGRSGKDASEHIGRAYSEAVLASTKQMRDAVLAATEAMGNAVLAGTAAMQESARAALTPLATESRALTQAIQQAGTSAADRVARARSEGEQRIEALRAAASEVATAATRSESALDGHSVVLREHATALQAMASQLAGALNTAGTAAAARQETVLDRNTGVLRHHATVLQEMTAQLATELGTADAAARSRQEALIVGQAEALREHAAALRETADRLACALERTSVTPPSADKDAADTDEEP